MAEDQEGLQPTEYVVKNPEALKRGMKERVTGALDRVIEVNPISKANAENLQKVQDALPEGRIKAATSLALDAAKVPIAMGAVSLEIAKTVAPIRLLLLAPEIGARVVGGLGGEIGKKIVESRPARFAIGNVEGVMDAILGKRTPSPEGPKPTLENAHQILVGMARPEMGKQERRKMG